MQLLVIFYVCYEYVVSRVMPVKFHVYTCLLPTQVKKKYARSTGLSQNLTTARDQPTSDNLSYFFYCEL